MSVNLPAPTSSQIFDASKLCKAVYQDNPRQGIPQGWDVLCDSHRINEFIGNHPELFQDTGSIPAERRYWEDHIVLDPSASSHRSVAYFNRQTNTIMIVNRGTVPSNLDNVVDDIRYIARYQTPPQWQEKADRFADIVLKYANQNNLRPFLTGHSAGANLSQNTSVRTQVTAIGFDPAGGEEILRNSPQGYDPNRCRNIYTYLTPPNPINQVGTPIGNVTHLDFRGPVGDRIRRVEEAAVTALRGDLQEFSDFMRELENPEALAQSVSQLLDTHSIDTITKEAFDQTSGRLHTLSVITEPTCTNGHSVLTPSTPCDQASPKNSTNNPTLVDPPSITSQNNNRFNIPFTETTFPLTNSAKSGQHAGIQILSEGSGEASFTENKTSIDDTPEYSSNPSRIRFSASLINGPTQYQRDQYLRYIRLFGLPPEIRAHHLHKVRCEQLDYYHNLEDHNISKEVQKGMVEESIEKWTVERTRQKQDCRQDEADKCENQILVAQEILAELNSASPSYIPREPKKQSGLKKLWEGTKEKTEKIINPTCANRKKEKRKILKNAEERESKRRKTEELPVIVEEKAAEQQAEKSVNHSQNTQQEAFSTTNIDNLNTPPYPQSPLNKAQQITQQTASLSAFIPIESVFHLPVETTISPAVLGKEIGMLHNQLSEIDPSQAIQLRQEVGNILNSYSSNGSGSAKEASAIVAASAFGLGALGPVGWAVIGGAAICMAASSRPEETREIIGQIGSGLNSFGSGLNSFRKLIFMTYSEKIEATALEALNCLVNNPDLLQDIRERGIILNREWQQEVMFEAARYLARIGENDFYQLATALLLIPRNIRAQAWIGIAEGPEENDPFWGQEIITGAQKKALTVEEVRSWFIAYLRQCHERQLIDRVRQEGENAILQSVVDGTIVRPIWYPQRQFVAESYFRKLHDAPTETPKTFLDSLTNDMSYRYALGLVLVNNPDALNEARCLEIAKACWFESERIRDDAIQFLLSHRGNLLLSHRGNLLLSHRGNLLLSHRGNLGCLRERWILGDVCGEGDISKRWIIKRGIRDPNDITFRENVAERLLNTGNFYDDAGDYKTAKQLYKASLLSNWNQEGYTRFMNTCNK